MGFTSPAGPLPSCGPIRLNGSNSTAVGIGEEFSQSGQAMPVGPTSLRSLWIGGPVVSSFSTFPHPQTPCGPPSDPNTRISMKEFYGALAYFTTQQALNFTASQTWQVPSTLIGGVISVLVVGGGGGGGTGSSRCNNQGAGGGGGAGAVIEQMCIPVVPGDTFSIVVGAGGNASVLDSGTRGGSGGCSAAFGFTATGGGGGGGIYESPLPAGASGGGGAASGCTPIQCGASAGPQGHAGGRANSSKFVYDAGGGGGGAGSAGGCANTLPDSKCRSGRGGQGVLSVLLQSTLAGGGAGGRHHGISGNGGGAGGGGGNGQNATFYGSGGGGGAAKQDGADAFAGNGYSGFVLIKGVW